MENSTFDHVTHWNVAINEEVRGRNDEGFGEVLEIRDGIVVTERGTLNKEEFYLSKSIRHGFSDHALLFDVVEEQAKNRFSGESIMTQEAKIQLTQPEFTAAESDRPIDVVRSKTDITIPLKKEDIKVKKKPYVKEKVIINKKELSETKTTSEQWVGEKISVRNHKSEEVREEK